MQTFDSPRDSENAELIDRELLVTLTNLLNRYGNIQHPDVASFLSHHSDNKQLQSRAKQIEELAQYYGLKWECFEDVEMHLDKMENERNGANLSSMKERIEHLISGISFEPAPPYIEKYRHRLKQLLSEIPPTSTKK